jgi:methylated-DNA-protein-cysteine methyltransferase-like protein
MKTHEPTEFTKSVIKLIKSIPKGRVATYGQIAALAGSPHGSRGVVWILTSSTRKHSLPWQRVVGAKGKISFPRLSVKFTRQSRMLEAEGIEIKDGKIDLLIFGWKKNPPTRKKAMS